jgi:hypothetical protein
VTEKSDSEIFSLFSFSLGFILSLLDGHISRLGFGSIGATHEFSVFGSIGSPLIGAIHVSAEMRSYS